MVWTVFLDFSFPWKPVMENLRLDAELPSKMASLDIWETPNTMEDEGSSHPKGTPVRRSSRRSHKTQSPTGVTNRRVILKPRKREFKISMTDDEIRNYYCNQKVKTTSQTLETIFEEPKAGNSSTIILIGSKKIKRSLTFPLGSTHTKEKIKRRRSKIKRLLGNKNFLNRKKLSMQTFINNLQSLDPDEPINPSLIQTIDEDDVITRETEK